MTRHAHAGEAPPVRNLGTSGLAMFDQAPRSEDQRQADILAWLDTLVPLAQELAQKAGVHGVTIADVRHYGEARELITGEESRTRGSYLGQLMKRAGLVETGQYRRSTIGRSHRNLHAVFVAPEFARAA